jgi:hypothetical protein
MPHISFSELKIWNECAWKHKLVYLEKIKAFQGNEYTAFGTALHSVCENLVEGNFTNGEQHFQEQFLKELKELPKDHVLNKKLVIEMRAQGKELCQYILPALKEYFGSYELFSVEEQLFEPHKDFKETEYNFKGFIDLTVKTSDGVYHVIDWKTCSWGWDSRRKTERMTTYQLTLYKHFFAKKHGIDPADIQTHFALLKRTAKNNNVELFKVTSGNKKTENALKLLNKALYNLHNEKHVKNRLACHGKFGTCEFYKTNHCT